MAITVGSVCSGIGGAEEAFAGLAISVFAAEIDKAPAAVLAFRHPEVPNFGDMTSIADRIAEEGGPAPDILVGGTPCQAWSIAGLRKSRADARANLAFEYIRLADQVDATRREAGEPECVILWENVPGVFSAKDNAFGCFLAGLVGADRPVEPAGKRGRWTRAGLVRGPKRAAAWRVADAQFFGLAQRRERVFVVASARPGFNPEQVLFEPEGVRRDHPPSREAGQTVTGTLAARTSAGGGLGTDFDLSGGLVCPETAACLTFGAHPGGHNGQDDTLDGRLIVCATGDITHTLRADGFDASEDGTGRGTPIVAAYGSNRRSGPLEVAAALLGNGGPMGRGDFESETFIVQPTAYDLNQVTCPTNRSNPQPGLSHALTQGAGAPTIAYAIQERAVCENPAAGPDGMGVKEGVAYTLEARSVPQAVAYGVALRGRDGGNTVELGDEVSYTLRAGDGGSDKAHVLAVNVEHGLSGGGNLELADLLAPLCASEYKGHTAVVHAFDARQNGVVQYGDVSGTLDSDRSGMTIGVSYDYAVRRLMPSECELLQGYPRGYTAVRYRGDAMTDGPRYKCLGNSWAVPVVRWIAQRIVAHMSGVL